MNNKERKELILNSLDEQSFDDINDAFSRIGGDVSALEAVPSGLRNEVIRIFEDLADGVINSKESIERLRAFVSSVPD
ncbi:MAG: hypothetical protein GY840_16510 [Pseudoalteromonas sp.]|nr:hypothetical protein [Pseudoalteromonas sp.]